MGLLNAISSINKINKLLKDLENQVLITQSQVVNNALIETLQNSLNVHKHIHQELIDTFAKSSVARVTVYTIFGDKMRFDSILKYSKNLIYNIFAIIESEKAL